MNTNNKNKIIIDFDRTVFDSDLLYSDMYSFCETKGISKGFLDYSMGFVPPKNELFNFLLMVERSYKIKYSKRIELLNDLKKFLFTEGSKYIFSDVDLFLNSAREDGYEVIILTYGDFDFQSAKYKGSGLSLFCNNFIITSTFKWQHFIMENSPNLIFLDDNPKNIDGVKICFPAVKVVEVKRLNTKYYNVYSSNCDLLVNHLDWPVVKKG